MLEINDKIEVDKRKFQLTKLATSP